MVRIPIPRLRSNRTIQFTIIEGNAETGDAPGKHFKLHVGDNLIGRGAMCDVILNSPTISRRHANLRVSFDQRSFTIEDLGSANGVRVGSRVLKLSKQPMESGEEVQVGEIKLRLLAVDKDDGSTMLVTLNDLKLDSEPPQGGGGGGETA
jgi:pSer/pThr/pTyr-binding forkhead associated (FHA) protein